MVAKLVIFLETILNKILKNKIYGTVISILTLSFPLLIFLLPKSIVYSILFLFIIIFIVPFLLQMLIIFIKNGQKLYLHFEVIKNFCLFFIIHWFFTLIIFCLNLLFLISIFIRYLKNYLDLEVYNPFVHILFSIVVIVSFGFFYFVFVVLHIKSTEKKPNLIIISNINNIITLTVSSVLIGFHDHLLDFIKYNSTGIIDLNVHKVEALTTTSLVYIIASSLVVMSVLFKKIIRKLI